MKQFSQPVYGPVDLRLVDDQRRCKTYCVAMRFLGQHANLKQTSNQPTRICQVPVQFDASGQAPRIPRE